MLYANFIGRQRDDVGGSIPLFNLVDTKNKHAQNGSTLSLFSLKKIGLDKITFRGYTLKSKEAANDIRQIPQIKKISVAREYRRRVYV